MRPDLITWTAAAAAALLLLLLAVLPLECRAQFGVRGRDLHRTRPRAHKHAAPNMSLHAGPIIATPQVFFTFYGNVPTKTKTLLTTAACARLT